MKKGSVFMSKKALIVYGGWEGHEPKQVSEVLESVLKGKGFDVTLSDTLNSFLDEINLKTYDLIVPNWTMGDIDQKQLKSLLTAVKDGTGIAGLHGGMGDAFRNEPEYQYMVGGQWVAHPGNDGVTYRVHILDKNHPITYGIDDFDVTSEQYYMHVDPGIKVLATTNFGDIVMPVVWTKTYGKGKVFYCSLGHTVSIVKMPQVLSIMTNGMIWATRGGDNRL
jgi:type 1 glutamine amidotransferase